MAPIVAQAWQAAPSVSTAGATRAFGVAVRQGSQLFVLGGTPWSATGDGVAHSFDGTSWSSQHDLDGQILHVGAAIDGLGRIVVFGGQGPTGDPGEDYVWNAIDGNNGSIASRSSLAPNMLFAVAGDAGNRIYSIGGGAGALPTVANPNSTRVERYDASTNTWSALAPMPAARADGAAAFDGAGHIVFTGGFDAAGVRSTDVFRYDIATDTWSAAVLTSLPAPRSGHRAVRGADDRIYVIGGSNGIAQSTTFRLDLAANVWASYPSMATPRQHFGCVLDAAGYIWAIGGANDGVGTNTCERLFTPTCASVATQPVDATSYLGCGAGFALVAAGTAPFTYQWRKNGQPLADGPSLGGGIVTGAVTSQLGILGVGALDGGSYDCVVGNSVGSATSLPATLMLVAPTPMPPGFAASNLHPAGRVASSASSVDGGDVVGDVSYVHPQWNILTEPVRWPSTGGAPTYLTPANSVGGSARAVGNGSIVGWWWWPYQTPFGTGYYQHACKWTGAGWVHVDMQAVGWELGVVNDTDGQHHVGGQRFDEAPQYPYQATAWGWTTSPSATFLTSPNSPSGGGGYGWAVDAGRAYGGTFSPVSHAQCWPMNGSPAIDFNPPGASVSMIHGAGDGQQVGMASIGGVSVWGVWSGSAGSFVSLNPSGVASCGLTDCEGGLQVGHVTLVGGATHAAIWSGTAQSWVDLHASLPIGYSQSQASGIDVDAGGVVTVAGRAYNLALARYEAFVWRGTTHPATYSTYGAGCAGSLGIPTLQAAAGSRPVAGSSFHVEVGNLPANIAVMALGLSDSTSGGLPLPLDLAVVGMPTCQLLMDPAVTDVLMGATNAAVWTWNVPNNAALFGQIFFNQAFSLDPLANNLGLVASNGGVGSIGQ